MKATCPDCEHVWSVPKEYAGTTVKCPKCKKPVKVRQVSPTGKFVLTVVISATLGALVVFSGGTLLTRPRRIETEEKTKQAEAIAQQALHDKYILEDELANAKDEIKQMHDIIQELERKQTTIVDLEEEKSGRKVDWNALGFSYFARLIPPKEKVGTAPSLLAPGYYFKVAYSEIIQVLGPDEMLISWKLIPSDHTMRSSIIRIKGYSTSGLTDGIRWPNAISENSDIAIIGTWTYTTTTGARKTVLTAIPLDFIRRDLTEAEFEQLLK